MARLDRIVRYASFSALVCGSLILAAMLIWAVTLAVRTALRAGWWILGASIVLLFGELLRKLKTDRPDV
jgi:hypothetical protein